WVKQMETVQLTYPLESGATYPPVVLAIGYFDGVHRGHQSVIRRAKDLAGQLGVSSAVMTFHPHPREVLGKSNISRYITPLPDKLSRFSRLGVNRTYVMAFDRTFAELTKEQDRKSTRLNSSHVKSSYAVFCFKKKIAASPTTASTPRSSSARQGQ